jgi:hypothetical protein
MIIFNKFRIIEVFMLYSIFYAQKYNYIFL